jgi:hypothetical protein
MLKTNGSVASREEYSDACTQLFIIPGRTWNADIPVGLCSFKIRYRFAGLTKAPAPAEETSVPSKVQLMDIVTDEAIPEPVASD